MVVIRLPETSRTAALLTAVTLGGCGSSVREEPTTAELPLSTATAALPSEPGSSASTSGAPSPTASGEQQAEFVPLAQLGEALGSGSGAASILGVRTGEHEGYERVVLDLDDGEGGAGDPAGWYATAVDQPLQGTSGELLDVDGDVFLDVGVTGLANAGDGSVDSAGRRAFIGDVDGGGGLVEQVHVGGAWEGQAQVLLGLDESVTEYRVLVLADPQRVVVDVR